MKEETITMMEGGKIISRSPFVRHITDCWFDRVLANSWMMEFEVTAEELEELRLWCIANVSGHGNAFLTHSFPDGVFVVGLNYEAEEI